jgi:hypothetical protein
LGRNDAADADAPSGPPDRPGVLGLEGTVPAVLLAQVGKPKRRRRKRQTRATAKIVFLYDASQPVVGEEILASDVFKAKRRDMVGVRSWDELGKAINGYAAIDRLVFSFHGYGGGMNVGGDLRDLDQKTVESLFSAKSGAAKTRADHISFIGCNVGTRPTKMAAFGGFLGASKVDGYTWYMVRQEITVELPKGTTEGDIRKSLDPYKKFVRPPLNTAAIARETRNRKTEKKLLIMYGSKDGATIKKFPVGFGAGREFKPIDEATERAVAAKKAAAAEKDIYNAPVTAFEKVVVTVK